MELKQKSFVKQNKKLILTIRRQQIMKNFLQQNSETSPPCLNNWRLQESSTDG